MKTQKKIEFKFYNFYFEFLVDISHVHLYEIARNKEPRMLPFTFYEETIEQKLWIYTNLGFNERIENYIIKYLKNENTEKN